METPQTPNIFLPSLVGIPHSEFTFQVKHFLIPEYELVLPIHFPLGQEGPGASSEEEKEILEDVPVGIKDRLCLHHYPLQRWPCSPETRRDSSPVLGLHTGQH